LPAPTDLGLPSISGTTEEGQTLFARTGIWGNDPTAYSYQWQRCAPRCSDVTGATGTSYTAVAVDIGARLRVLVSARNPGGTTVAASPLLGPVGPSATRVRTALRTLLGRLSAHRTLAMLLRGKGCALRFDAPSGGVLTLRWSVTPPRGRRDAGRAIAAFVVRVWARRGPGVMVQLTPRLERWLTRQGGPRVLVTAKFSAVGGPTLVRSKWFLLKGRST
jgi:hypothetical protein